MPFTVDHVIMSISNKISSLTSLNFAKYLERFDQQFTFMSTVFSQQLFGGVDNDETEICIYILHIFCVLHL